MLLAAALFAAIAPPASAQTKESEAPLQPNPARPAIGDWIGQVSWNAPIVSYAWRINPHGTFSSGRFGRAQDGGGAWGTNGMHLTLKYAGGFRYEGNLKDNTYDGTAYDADGSVFGGFSMRRAAKRGDITEDDAN
jgi:hypothetical protein